MNLDDINRLGMQLKRDPQVALPMQDALEDLGMSWDDWLQASGTFDRLAECMCSLAVFTHASGEPPRSWLKAMGLPRPDGAINHGDGPHWFCYVCRPFTVPPVVLGLRLIPPPDIDWETNYHAPPRESAALVLRLARQFAAKHPVLLEYPALPGAAPSPRPTSPTLAEANAKRAIERFVDLPALRQAIRQLPPNVIGYEIWLHGLVQTRNRPD